MPRLEEAGQPALADSIVGEPSSRDDATREGKTIIGTAGTMHEPIVALVRASPDSPPNDSLRP